MDAPNSFPGLGHRPTLSAAIVEQWRRNGGRRGNVLGHGDETPTERVDPAVSVDQRTRVEMPVPNGVASDHRARLAPLGLVYDWNPSLNSQRLNLGYGGGDGTDTLSTMFQGCNLSDVPAFPSCPRNLPQQSWFQGVSAPPIGYMNHRFRDKFASPNNAIAGADCSTYSSSSSSARFTTTEGDGSGSSSSSARRLIDEEEAFVCQDYMGAQLLYLDQMRSGYELLLRTLNNNSEESTTDVVMREVYARDVHCIMADELGSQLFVALLAACNGRQVQALVQIATSDGVQLAKAAGRSKFGCHCIRKLIDKVKASPALSQRVVSALAAGAPHLMTAENGREVLKHCFRNLRHDQTFVLVKAAVGGFMQYATDVKGCGSLKYCISNARGPLKQLLLNMAATNALQLATHCYGNYVIQHVLDEDSEDVKKSILVTMATNFAKVATTKSGSFVLEKLLNIPRIGPQLCYMIARDVQSGAHELEQIARNQFGNYVLQRALDVCLGAAPDVHSSLVHAIAALPRSLMTDPYANKLYKTALHSLPSFR